MYMDDAIIEAVFFCKKINGLRKRVGEPFRIFGWKAKGHPAEWPCFVKISIFLAQQDGLELRTAVC